jgi:hypothetical protein
MGESRRFHGKSGASTFSDIGLPQPP